MKHKTRMVVIAVILLAFAFIAYRAEAAMIVNPIDVPNCALCAPKASVQKAPMPVAEKKTGAKLAPKETKTETVEVNTEEIEKLLKQIAELQKVLAALLAKKN